MADVSACVMLDASLQKTWLWEGCGCWNWSCPPQGCCPRNRAVVGEQGCCCWGFRLWLPCWLQPVTKEEDHECRGAAPASMMPAQPPRENCTIQLTLLLASARALTDGWAWRQMQRASRTSPYTGTLPKKDHMHLSFPQLSLFTMHWIQLNLFKI